nr:hypothetical protein [Actinomycetota bacterium]
TTPAADLPDAAQASLSAPAWNAPAEVAVAALGDVSGDGRADFAVGRPRDRGHAPDLRGTVSVVFGAPAGPLELGTLRTGGYEIDGPPATLEEGSPDGEAGAYAGTAVAGLGDVNGDGVGDLAVGAPGASPADRLHAGSVYVIFGSPDARRIELSGLDSRGFRLDGDRPENRAGMHVAPAGDVNGDGLADILVGIGGSVRAGHPLGYVVFGKRDTTPVDLRHLGGGGYRFLTSTGYPDPAWSVAAGEVNGDGRADTLVTVSNFGSFVVFGRQEAGDVVLDALHSGGYEFRDRGHRAAATLRPAGDVNRDGRADVLLGMLEREESTGETAFVHFGRGASRPVRIDNLGADGYEIVGPRGLYGMDLVNAEDVDGDGRPDAAVTGTSTGDRLTERIHVVYGRARPGRVDLRRPSDGSAMRIEGPRVASGSSEMATPGDLNGDGRAELVLGAARHMRACRADLGAAFVVNGAPRNGIRRVERLSPRQGYMLEGARPGDWIGSIVRGAGDLDGDGRNDLLVGSDGRDKFQDAQYPFQLHVVTRAPRLETRRTIPTASCLRLRLLDTSLRRLAQEGSLPVRVALRHVQRAPDRVFVEIHADEGPLARGTARALPLVPAPPIADATLVFRRAGVQTGRLRVNPFARARLRRLRQLRVRVGARNSRSNALKKQLVLRLGY